MGSEQGLTRIKQFYAEKDVTRVRSQRVLRQLFQPASPHQQEAGTYLHATNTTLTENGHAMIPLHISALIIRDSTSSSRIVCL